MPYTFKTTEDFANLALVDWQSAVDAMPQEIRHRIETDAASLAQHYARISAYLSARSNGNHGYAVKRQNQAVRKVRQALGYTYADDAITF